ncbi:MAG TPA: hypothetical protein VJ973_02725, partial [Christiangramia sp.]|nr:hypothetical protein [Christiangramia sp.]
MVIITDRVLYITGETLFYSGNILIGSDNKLPGNILYLELVTPEGEQIIEIKKKTFNNIFDGTITLPEEILSGYYYLRAYTSSMRNQSPETFGYCLLKIVNSDNYQVLTQESEAGNKNRIAELEPDQNTEDAIRIFTAAESYSTRSNVDVDFRLNTKSSDSLKKIIISIIPESTTPRYRLGFKDDLLPEDETLYYPELNEISISGKIEGESNYPLTLNITLLKEEINEFIPVRTDDSGRFIFSFPALYGNHDLFLSYNAVNTSSLLKIDNDFYSTKLSLPAPEFKLSDLEEKAAYQLALNLKVNSYFQPDSVLSEMISDHAPVDTLPFYGKPNQLILIDDFIKMSKLSDYFTELPVPVKVIARKENSEISIEGPGAGLNAFPPLVMIDFLPVYDYKTILN